MWLSPATATFKRRCVFDFFEAVGFAALQRSGTGALRALAKNALVAGAFGVTVSAAMKTLSAKAKISGFTLIELLVVICLIAVLAAMMLPIVGGPRQARRIICSNNLKSIDESFVAWSQGHDGKLPMQVSETNGGSMEFISSGGVVVHFLTLTDSKLPLIERGTKFFSRDGTNVSEPYSITNYGLKPDILVCPSDSSRRDEIYQKKSNAEITDTNISYFVGVDATLNNPKSILSGDRNLQVDNFPARPGLFALTQKSSVGWTEGLHFSKSIGNSGGNILFADGHVEYLKPKALNSVFQSQDLATNRFAVP